jgi:hypothetical protein
MGKTSGMEFNGCRWQAGRISAGMGTPCLDTRWRCPGAAGANCKRMVHASYVMQVQAQAMSARRPGGLNKPLEYRCDPPS